MPSNKDKLSELRFMLDPSSATIVLQAERDIKNLKILVATAFDIVDEELLPNIAVVAVQGFSRLNQFMIDARPIKKEIEEDD